MDAIFGKDISRYFFALEDGEYINLPSQAPAIYLYSYQPSLTEARAGTGSFASVVTWVMNAVAPYPRTYTLPAINDPEPTSSTQSRGYWEAINYIAQTSGQQQTVIRKIEVERAFGLESVPGTTKEDLKEVFPAIGKYVTDAQLNDFLVLAEGSMKLDLESLGYEWGKLYKLSKCKLALAYKTISMASFSQFVELNDRFYIRWKEFDALYKATMKSITLPYDSDGDGEPESEAKGKNSFAWIIK